MPGGHSFAPQRPRPADNLHHRERWVGGGVWVLLVICLLSSVMAASAWRSYLYTASQSEFNSRSADLAASVESALRRDSDFMASMSAVMSAKPDMTNEEFALWLSSVGVTYRYAGGIGYLFVQRVPANQLAYFQQKLISDPPRVLSPSKDLAVVPAGVRRTYCIARLGLSVGVPAENAAATALPLGYDFCAAATASGLGTPFVDRAEASGAGHTNFTVQPVPGVSGVFAIAAPVFGERADIFTAAGRNAGLLGWALGTFDGDAIVAGGATSHDGLRVEVFHRNPGDGLLQVAGQGTAATNGFLREAEVDADGSWLVRITGRTAGNGWSPDTQAGACLVAGFLLSALLFGFVNLLNRSRSKAIDVVDETTEQLRIQSAALLVEKSLLANVIDNIPHIVYWKDLEGRYRGANHAFLERRGIVAGQDILGHTDDELGLDDLVRAKGRELEQQVTETGVGILNQHVTLPNGEGASWTLLVSVLPQRGPDGEVRGLIAVAADVTHLAELERAMSQVNRLESIGQLAAGIAHEINTPVQFVSDNVRFLTESFGEIVTLLDAIVPVLTSPLEADSPEWQRAREAVAAADLAFLNAEIPTALSESREGLERVAEIVRAMKDFSHPGSGRVDTDVNRALESTVQVSRNEWKYVAELAVDLDPRVGMLPCFEGELKQVILNMIVNAAHAIGERRSLTDDPTMGLITLTTRREAEFVTIKIGDDGSGMTEETRRRVFDPFFTTKPVGKGTGQGLSLAHNTIVQKHGGRIEVASVPGQGTTFTLFLPCQAATEPATVDEAALV